MRSWVTLVGTLLLVGSASPAQAGDKGASDKGASDKGASDKGASDKGASDKGASDKGASDKGASDKGASDKGASDKGASDKGASDKGASDKGASDKGASDKGASDKGVGEEAPEAVTFEVLVSRAVERYDAGAFDEAAELLEHAYVLRREPRVLYNLARAYERGGRTKLALDCYRRYLEQLEVEPDLADRAREAVARLETPPPPQEQPKPPRQRAPGHRAKLKSKQPAPPEDNSAQIASIVLFAAGGAALGVATGLGVWALQTAADARDTFDPEHKPDLRDAAEARALATDVVFGAGAALLGAGLVVYLVGGSDGEPSGGAVGWSGLWP